MLRAVTLVALCTSVPAFADDDRLELGASTLRGSRLRAGEIEVSGPILAGRYGLTDDTTVGAGAWPLLGFATGGGGVHLALDRHGALGRWRWDVGAVGAFVDLHTREAGFQLRALGLHASAEWLISRRHAIGLAVLGGGLTYRVSSDSEIRGVYAGNHIEGVATMATYVASPWRWFAIELALGTLPYVQIGTDDIEGMTSEDRGLSLLKRGAGKLHLHVRVGHWRTSLGVAVAPLVGIGWPTLSIARKW
jgi:hypothetical protein